MALPPHLEKSLAQRLAERELWLAWAARAQRDIGALLAETISRKPGSDALREIIHQLAVVEQDLASFLGLT